MKLEITLNTIIQLLDATFKCILEIDKRISFKQSFSQQELQAALSFFLALSFFADTVPYLKYLLQNGADIRACENNKPIIAQLRIHTLAYENAQSLTKIIIDAFEQHKDFQSEGFRSQSSGGLTEQAYNLLSQTEKNILAELYTIRGEIKDDRAISSMLHFFTEQTKLSVVAVPEIKQVNIIPKRAKSLNIDVIFSIMGLFAGQATNSVATAAEMNHFSKKPRRTQSFNTA